MDSSKMSRRIFADNLLRYMKSRDIDRNEICRALGVKYTTLCDWVNAKTYPRIDKIELLADFFGIAKKDLIEEKDESTETAVPPIVPIYDSLNAGGQKELLRYGRYLCDQEEYKAAEQTAKIEYIRSYFIPAAAGYASPIEGEDYELVPRDGSVPYNADFCVSIQGDSMEPYIKDGQRVYVQRDTELSDFDVGIFYVDGDVLCKQFCTDSVGTLYLLSANPKREDANRIIYRESAGTVVCFGKVILPQKLPQPRYI